MADKKKYIIANWKMNMTLDESVLFVDRINKEVVSPKDIEIVICPTFLPLTQMAKKIDQKKFKLGAQNFYHADHGTYTGEVSAFQLKDFVQYGLVGHSDRRQKFSESDQDIARKMAAAVRVGIKPVLCVGEDLLQRQDGLTNIILHDQVSAALAMLTAEDISSILIAYEPIWAISNGDGHGEDAGPDMVKKAVLTIRKTVGELYGKKAESSLKVLYGGSSNPDNALGYMNITGVDGLLVGGASLNYKSFADIINKATKS